MGRIFKKFHFVGNIFWLSVLYGFFNIIFGISQNLIFRRQHAYEITKNFEKDHFLFNFLGYKIENFFEYWKGFLESTPAAVFESKKSEKSIFFTFFKNWNWITILFLQYKQYRNNISEAQSCSLNICKFLT